MTISDRARNFFISPQSAGVASEWRLLRQRWCSPGAKGARVRLYESARYGGDVWAAGAICPGERLPGQFVTQSWVAMDAGEEQATCLPERQKRRFRYEWRHDGNHGRRFTAGIWPYIGKNLREPLMALERHISVRVYIAGMALAAFGCFAAALFQWHSADPIR